MIAFYSFGWIVNFLQKVICQAKWLFLLNFLTLFPTILRRSPTAWLKEIANILDTLRFRKSKICKRPAYRKLVNFKEYPRLFAFLPILQPIVNGWFILSKIWTVNNQVWKWNGKINKQKYEITSPTPSVFAWHHPHTCCRFR